MYPGATSEQVEKQVTKTLEKHIFKFPEVRKEKTYSTSRPGVAIINVELEDNVKNSDVFWAKLRHEMNVVKSTELPSGVMGPVVDSDFGDTVAMLIAVHGKRYGYRELRDFADKIHDEMRTIREVGKLVTYGNQIRRNPDHRQPGKDLAVFCRSAPGGECPERTKHHPGRREF